MRKRNFEIGFESGEYIHTWNGFTPYYCGSLYGNMLCLGGEEKFSNCYDFFSGIGDVEWWIKEELEKLSNEDKKELLNILERNKSVKDYIDENFHKIEQISFDLHLEGSHIIYCLGNRNILRLLISKNIEEEYKKIVAEIDLEILKKKIKQREDLPFLFGGKNPNCVL